MTTTSSKGSAVGVYRLVAVGTDGSETSYRAVDRAAALASTAGAPLLVVCAYQPESREVLHDAADAMGGDAFNVMSAGPAEEKLARVRDHLRDQPVEVDTVAVEGDPAEVLLGVVTERKADVLVVGNRGLNTLSGRLLGSVPDSVSRRSPVDVLVVRTTS